MPLLDAQGTVLGLLYGGDLLNQREDLVDSIRDAIFRLSGPGRHVAGHGDDFSRRCPDRHQRAAKPTAAARSALG